MAVLSRLDQHNGIAEADWQRLSGLRLGHGGGVMWFAFVAYMRVSGSGVAVLPAALEVVAESSHPSIRGIRNVRVMQIHPFNGVRDQHLRVVMGV